MLPKVRCVDKLLFSTTALKPFLNPITLMNVPREPLAFDIVARIAERAPELRSAERKVAALILDDLTGASRASIGALAEKAEVSIATVTRFAKAVGCADVRELKLRLAQAAAVGQRFLKREPDDLPDSARHAHLRGSADDARAQPGRAARRADRSGGRCARRGVDDLRVRHGRRLDRALRRNAPSGSCGSAGRWRRIRTACCSAWSRRRCRRNTSWWRFR